MKRKVVELGVKTFSASGLLRKISTARDKIHLNFVGFLKLKKVNVVH